MSGTPSSRQDRAKPDLSFHFNLSRIDFAKTLGVMAYAKRLAQHLAELADVSLVIPGDARVRSDSINFLPGAKVLREGQSEFRGIEMLAHHFQVPLTGRPTITIFHDLHLLDIPWKYIGSKQLNEAFYRNATNSDALVTEFPRVYYDLPRAVPGTTNSLFMIASPPLDTENVSAAAEFPEELKGRRFVYYPGQLQEHKNHANLIRALRHLPADLDDLLLVFSGSDAISNTGWHRLKGLADQQGFGDRVTYLGFVSKAVQESVFSACAAVICPSLAEGGAYVVLEAILRGRPVIASGIRAIQLHLARYGLEVDQFDPLSPADIAKAITTVLRRNTPRAQPASAISALNNESWENTARQILVVASWMQAGRPESIPSIQLRLEALRKSPGLASDPGS
jgi:glycosyltransferase involved in cell wall biosynthesis